MKTIQEHGTSRVDGDAIDQPDYYAKSSQPLQMRTAWLIFGALPGYRLTDMLTRVMAPPEHSMGIRSSPAVPVPWHLLGVACIMCGVRLSRRMTLSWPLEVAGFGL